MFIQPMVEKKQNKLSDTFPLSIQIEKGYVLQCIHKGHELRMGPFQQLQTANTITAENINEYETHLYFILRRKRECDERAKEEHRVFPPRYKCASSRQQPALSKMVTDADWFNTFSEALSRCCSFWLSVMQGTCSTFEKQGLTSFKICTKIPNSSYRKACPHISSNTSS